MRSSKDNAKTVQGTNDNSILSKHAMTNAGYITDKFLQAFTLKKAPRRSPLINRGYYIRSQAIDSIISQFVQEPGPKQIISLGAGFDTTFFKLSSQSQLAPFMQHVQYVEMDFPEVALRKQSLMERDEHCSSYLKPRIASQHSSINLCTPNYCLIGVDLAKLSIVKEVLFSHVNLSASCPTLFLSECVMTYMDTKISSDLIQFAKIEFPESVFVTYEQVEPHNAYGQFMQAHFDKLNSSLKGINTFTNKAKQEERYETCGYDKVT